MSSGKGWGAQNRENDVNTTKEERDQWRKRLSSAYTCFDATHADFTLRLLDALEDAEADKRRLEREADWLAKTLHEVDGRVPVQWWRRAARRAMKNASRPLASSERLG